MHAITAREIGLMLDLSFEAKVSLFSFEDTLYYRADEVHDELKKEYRGDDMKRLKFHNGKDTYIADEVDEAIAMWKKRANDLELEISTLDVIISRKDADIAEWKAFTEWALKAVSDNADVPSRFGKLHDKILEG